MDLWRSIGGLLTLKLTSADTASALSRMNADGIVLYDVQQTDDPLCVCFQIARADLKKVRIVTEKRGEMLTVMGRRGIFWSIRSLVRRPVICFGLLIFVFLVCFLPTRVLFFRVEGNSTVPTRLILEKCSEFGIGFGASRAEVRSEKLKNALLEAIPELQWAGINTSGCVATISVRERPFAEIAEDAAGICSIVASRDGVITELTVTRGSAECAVGDAVRAGQVLISGYTDCGITIRAEQAEGEVYASTEHALNVVTPAIWDTKGETIRQIKKYSLIIGKNRINLYKGSGISDSSCDKMYVENYITLPGGFYLPVAIVTETWVYREVKTCEASGEEALSDFAARYLQQHMVAGQILSRQETVQQEDGIFRLTGNYACLEMIGAVKHEEIITPNGKHD